MSNRRPRTSSPWQKVIYLPRREKTVLSSAGTFRERAQRPSEARLRLEALFSPNPLRA